jgi:hypothetical protein
VDVPQRLVAFGDGVDDDAEGKNVEQAGQVTAAGALDLAVDAIKMLDTARDLRFDADGAHLLAQDRADALDIRAPLLRLLGDRVAQPAILLRLQHGEGDILQLPLDTPHAQPRGERRVDLTCLLGQHQALLQRPGRRGE